MLISRILPALTLTLVLISTIPAAAKLIIASGNPKAPPVMWEERKQLIGVGPDLASIVLTRLKMDFQIKVEGDWQTVQEKMASGKVDMIVAAYKNEQRQEYMEYSIPYLPQPTVIITKRGNEFDFNSWDALIDKQGVSNIGESYGQKFDKFAAEKLDIQYMAFERAIQVLKRDEVDYMIIDLFTALIYARILRGEHAITILDPAVTTQAFHITVGKNSPLAGKMEAINKIIKEQLETGAIEQMMMKHFNSWKKLAQERSAFYQQNNRAQTADQIKYARERDRRDQERLGALLGDRDIPGIFE